MNTNQSLSDQITEVLSDPFNFKNKQPSIDVDLLSLTIKQHLTPHQSKFLDEGAVFYKKDLTSCGVITNLLQLYSEIAVQSLTTSDINEKEKSDVISAYKKIIQGAIQSICSIHEISCTLNKQTNFIDVQKISYIILGYALDIIKRNTKTSE